MRTVFTLTLLCLLAAGQARAQTSDQWAPSAGAMVGSLNSNDFTPFGRLIEAKSGYKSALTGRSWDVCAAHGRSAAGHIRICYTQVRVDDGSQLSDEFTDGTTEAVVVKGFKVERMWRFGPRKWPVAPAVSYHWGMGKVSGAVRLTEYDTVFDPRTFDVHRGRPMSTERQPAGDILAMVGKNWTLITGASVGATATLGPHMTVNVGVYGIELPGAYKGQVQFVYWPR